MSEITVIKPEWNG